MLTHSKSLREIKREYQMDQTLQEFLGINCPARSKKPRREGITVVMDTGWPTTFCESMLAVTSLQR